ncbi:MAG: HesA/MoeB/ThiF family protein [Dehalococcoidia bacterium]|nr:HesA/MoeB/ThiF family protein [Dehalococcoidia bacterium]
MKENKQPLTTLSQQEQERYDRQVSIKGFGRKRQLKLKKARIIVAGIGGVGSSASMYLAVAGIGSLTVIDSGEVELSNLNRQILHWEKNLGTSKALSAATKLKQLNPDIEVTAREESITEDSVLKLLEGTDGVIDCLDNFPSRYILNDAALKLGVPVFHAACSGFEVRATTIIPGVTPCLRCLYPRELHQAKVPILGSIAGMAGNIATTEAIKLIAGLEPTLKNRLLIYDGLHLRYNLVNISRNPDCLFCKGVRTNEG